MTLYREIDLLIISKILFSQPLFFKRISGYPFTRGLSPSDISQRGATARVFKTAVAGNGIYPSCFKTKNQELK
ncbi:hypothetical protein C8Q69DRAFT_454331 [Paecilomyces variotii]|uniref:Uncharacterized protein n=1 Tax=Byssochlamys spectabilis TaxID=264951 RepID=A0A443I884_BYSSP|nr:hypothetical protein C8Q69DRAFT_454331 [Paecilomyces variotii]RWR00272.1 hypothetical protein C8Q69DRAFT_454331 [Paecilomyces variotii]